MSLTSTGPEVRLLAVAECIFHLMSLKRHIG
jgi:hypothetical protein